MRKWIATGSLCFLLALAGCRATTYTPTATPIPTEKGPPPAARGVAPDAPAPRVVYTMPVIMPRSATAPQPPSPEVTTPTPTSPSGPPILTPAAPGSAPLAGPSIPGADEIALALKENEDALATLRTAQRALEASHKKLEALLKRQGSSPPPTWQVPASFSAPVGSTW